MKVEYRVRPVIRYVITRWSEGVTERLGKGGPAVKSAGGCETLGEFDNEEQAHRVSAALVSWDKHFQSNSLGALNVDIQFKDDN